MDHLLENVCTIPASWKEHGLLNEHRTGKKDVPAGPNIIRTEKEMESDDYPEQQYKKSKTYVAKSTVPMLLSES